MKKIFDFLRQTEKIGGSGGERWFDGHFPCLLPGIYDKMFDQMKIFLWPLVYITCQNSYVATKLENLQKCIKWW